MDVSTLKATLGLGVVNCIFAFDEWEFEESQAAQMLAALRALPRDRRRTVTLYMPESFGQQLESAPYVLVNAVFWQAMLHELCTPSAESSALAQLATLIVGRAEDDLDLSIADAPFHVADVVVGARRAAKPQVHYSLHLCRPYQLSASAEGSIVAGMTLCGRDRITLLGHEAVSQAASSAALATVPWHEVYFIIEFEEVTAPMEALSRLLRRRKRSSARAFFVEASISTIKERALGTYRDVLRHVLRHLDVWRYGVSCNARIHCRPFDDELLTQIDEANAEEALRTLHPQRIERDVRLEELPSFRLMFQRKR